MNPIYNEYLTFLRDTNKQPLEDLKEGYFWLDKSIIKGFDKQGNEHKFYRVKIENSLERLDSCVYNPMYYSPNSQVSHVEKYLSWSMQHCGLSSFLSVSVVSFPSIIAPQLGQYFDFNF